MLNRSHSKYLSRAPALKYYVVMSTAEDPERCPRVCEKHDAKQLDLRFTDLPGLQQHISYPMSQLKEDTFEEGFGIDGSSIRGWAAINESDMLLIPDPDTAVIDPSTKPEPW